MSRSEESADRGVALVIALLAMSLLLAFGLALPLVTMTETAIAAGHTDAAEALYAADAMSEFALQDLAGRFDWAAVIAGAGSPFRDGTAIPAVAPEATAAWRLYAYGWLSSLVPPDMPVPAIRLAAWVAEDGAQPGVLRVQVRATGRSSARAIEVTIARNGAIPNEVRLLSWREVR